MKTIINLNNKNFFIYFILLIFCTIGYGQKPTVKFNNKISKQLPYNKINNTFILNADQTYFKGGSFIIRTASDYRYLTVKDVVPRDKSIVYMWQFVDNRDNQQLWELIPTANEYYKIRSASGFYLSQKRLLAPTVEVGANEDSQLWKLEDSGDGFYYIVSKTNRYMGVTGLRNGNGRLVGFGSSSQNKTTFKWHLIKWKNDGRKQTAFNPATQGFKFANTFGGVDASRRYGGLCAGMIYSTLDYYNAGMNIPTQNYRPANRTVLQSYLYKRQNNSSFESNLDKWIELRGDALGTRNSEFFSWGLRGYNGGRLQELRTAIDNHKSVPIGMYVGQAKGLDGFETGDHQVLGIGYAVGRYTGDMNKNKGDLKIFVYDPNHPNKTMTLVPDLINECYLEVESGTCWRTYFVDNKYSPNQPPVIQSLPYNEADGHIRHLYATFATGGDDLRGGNDNVSLTINYKDGTNQTFNNVNLGARWIDNYEETVPLILNRTISKSDIASFTISTNFGGGIGGDNWNLDKFFVSNGGNIIIVCANCEESDRMPMVRFTGSIHEKNVIVH